MPPLGPFQFRVRQLLESVARELGLATVRSLTHRRCSLPILDHIIQAIVNTILETNNTIMEFTHMINTLMFFDSIQIGPHQTPMQQHDIGGMQAALSTQPVPEFWCSVAYFELDTQVTAYLTHLCIFLFIYLIFLIRLAKRLKFLHLAPQLL